MMLDGLNDDDGVVDHKADSQHQPEEGEGVQREPEERKEGECSDQGNRDGNRRNERGTPVLQEEEDHDEDEDHRLKEGLHDIMHAGGYCQRGVEGALVFQPRREDRGRLGHQLPRILGHGQRVATRELVDGNDGRRMTVVAACEVVGLRPEFHTGHILDPDDRAVAIGADDDVGKLLLGHQTPGSPDCEGHLLSGRDRFGTGLPGGIDGILLIDRVIDLLGRDVEVCELRRIKPQAHGILPRAEDSNTRDTSETGQGVDDVDVGIVGEEDGVVAVIIRVEGEANQR